MTPLKTRKLKSRNPEAHPTVARADAHETICDRPMPRGGEAALVVEDDIHVREMIRLVLRGRGYTVLEASCGREAVNLCESHDGPIHILVTDMVMPGMTGNELFDRVTSMRPGMAVLYLSGHNESTLDLKCQLRPGDQFLQKPFSLDVLLSTIRTILDK